jgi:hypothetical protein
MIKALPANHLRPGGFPKKAIRPIFWQAPDINQARPIISFIQKLSARTSGFPGMLGQHFFKFFLCHLSGRPCDIEDVLTYR